MPANSGQAALKGFYLQCLVVILEGANCGDWTDFTIEPCEESSGTINEPNSLQKVDILWTLTDGAERFDQVKYRSSPISPRDITAWTAEMIQASSPNPSRSLRLHIVGPTKGDIPNAPNGVEVLVHGTEPNAESRGVMNLIRWFEDTRPVMGVSSPTPSTVEAEKALNSLVGTLLTESRHGKKWARQSFKNELMSLQAHFRHNSEWSRIATEPVPAHAAFKVLAIIPEHSDHIAFYITVEAENRTNQVLMNAHLPLRLTDTSFIRDLYCLPDNNTPEGQIPRQESNTFVVDFSFPGPFEPGTTRTCAVYFQRGMACDWDDVGGCFIDPAFKNPEGSDYRYKVTIILPYCSKFNRMNPPPAYHSMRIVELSQIAPSDSTQKIISVYFIHEHDTEITKKNNEERLKRLLISRYRLNLSLEPEPDVSDDPHIIEEEIAELKRICRVPR